MKPTHFLLMAFAVILFVSCNNDNDRTNKHYSAKDFFAEAVKKSSQTVELNTSDLPQTVTLRGGTKITIKEGTFTKKGTPLSGDFTLEAREFLKPSDIVLNGLNTLYRDGSPLISDGFLYLNVSQDGVPVDQILAKNLLVEIPNDDTRYQTQLWEGGKDTVDNREQFTWDDFPADALNGDIDQGVLQEGNWVWRDQKQGSASFAFNLGKLGWYNCDVFWDSSNGKTTIYVKLTGYVGELASYQGYFGDTFVFFCGKSDNVVAQLYTPLQGVFGVQSYENSMPVGKIGKIIAFAIKEGKFYFAVKDNVTIEADLSLELDLKETTKEEIQTEFAKLDNFK
ncbi:MAG: hypothetical protein LBD45_04075 [Bacteroidales bacterium]|jgi:hypothetical protein|nr:hypothetical protein [Bacteroidales bacterium]